jgi:type II secretory pathway component GspD/PulD (secretin)
MVKDGATIIIGGMRKEDKTSNEEKFPFLGDIPFIGALFKSTTKSTERTELLIMITPNIVTGDVLTTGDERDMRKEGKNYRDYGTMADGMDFAEPPAGKPIEEKIRPYREYRKEKDEK